MIRVGSKSVLGGKDSTKSPHGHTIPALIIHAYARTPNTHTIRAAKTYKFSDSLVRYLPERKRGEV
jgi:hypothetical protein